MVALLFGALLLFGPRGGLALLASGEPFGAPSLSHPLGADDLGRDLLTALGQGARTSLMVGLGVTGLALGIGLLVGVTAGLAGGRTDALLMRAADVVASLPTLIIALLVAALFGGSLPALILVLGVTRWPLVARLARVETASLKAREFVRAAEALGAPGWRVALAHILPQVATVALASSSLLFGGALLSEAALAFLGLGDPSLTSLGQLAANGFLFVTFAPRLWIAPVLTLMALTALVAVALDPAGRWRA
jgi:ABC-type dipeptide/oligopeptide/nickel transport system permease subunit